MFLNIKTSLSAFPDLFADQNRRPPIGDVCVEIVHGDSSLLNTIERKYISLIARFPPWDFELEVFRVTPRKIPSARVSSRRFEGDASGLSD